MTTLKNSTGGTAPRRATCSCGQFSVTYDGPDPARISPVSVLQLPKAYGQRFKRANAASAGARDDRR